MSDPALISAVNRAPPRSPGSDPGEPERVTARTGVTRQRPPSPSPRSLTRGLQSEPRAGAPGAQSKSPSGRGRKKIWSAQQRPPGKAGSLDREGPSARRSEDAPRGGGAGGSRGRVLPRRASPSRSFRVPCLRASEGRAEHLRVRRTPAGKGQRAVTGTRCPTCFVAGGPLQGVS